jgi:transposase InsO family protein
LLKSRPSAPPEPSETRHEAPSTKHPAEPNQTWHLDLTVAPTGGGFWCPWLPGSLPQRLPFGWWIAAVVDGYSRRVLQLACYAEQPTARRVQKLLARTIREVAAKPRSILCDRGAQFDCRSFRSWCNRRRIDVRYGAVGRHGSIAVVERFIRTLKEYLAKLTPLPLERRAMTDELRLFAEWFNEHRPHEFLGGRTPNEAYERRFPAIRKPRYEPRANWPRASPCARPWALIRGSPGAKLELVLDYHGGRRHLPIVMLKRVG